MPTPSTTPLSPLSGTMNIPRQPQIEPPREEMLRENAFKAIEKRNLLVQCLTSSLNTHARIEELMQHVHPLILDALNADGLVVKAYVHRLHYGYTPCEDVMEALLEWLKTHQSNGIMHTHDASAYFRNVPVLEQLTGGILALPISAQSHDYILWFRKPIGQTTQSNGLSPHHGFELCKEQAMDHGALWTEDDVHTGRCVVNILLESEKLSAQHANAAKTEFLNIVSHEIRTPMNAIIGLSNLLVQSQPLTTKQSEILKTLQLSADGLLSLVNDLLDISKIESRNLQLEMIPFDLTPLLQEVIRMTSMSASEKGVRFSLEDNRRHHCMYIGDPNRIRQIILNLCGNAAKFTERGHIDISIHTQATSDPLVETLCVQVRDTGIGIAPDKIHTIFNKFAQAENSISRKYGGTGLGLAITKMLTEAMGGTITVESVLGKGSTFTVCFDLKIVDAHSVRATQTPPFTKALDPSKPHILWVQEDDTHNVAVYEGGEYMLDRVHNGIEAAEKAREHEYSVIVMDMEMQAITGFDVAEMIRANERANGKAPVPIIAMTVHTSEAEREQCLAAGMDAYIVKPATMHELLQAVHMHMRIKKGNYS
jgi:two-component system, chemotaxis family, sensor kinase Cph1